jgi:hypothetical protein
LDSCCLYPSFLQSWGRAVIGCLGLNGTGAWRRRSPRDFPRLRFPTPTPATGVQVRLTQPPSHFLFAGDLWVTASARDFAISPPGLGEKESAALHPLPFRHHFGPPARSLFGVPSDFQQGRQPFCDLSSVDHLSLRRSFFSHDPAVPGVLQEWRGRDAKPVGYLGVGGGAVPGGGASGAGPAGAQSHR